MDQTNSKKYELIGNVLILGLRELCWNNFGNFETTQYSIRIEENNWGIIEHKRNNEEHNTSNLCHRMVEDRKNQGTKLGTDSERKMS